MSKKRSSTSGVAAAGDTSPLVFWDSRLEKALDAILFAAGGQRPYPPADKVEEDREAYTVELDLPGVNRDDINVDVTGRRVHVQGRRVEEERDTSLRHSTRRSGVFSYEVSLPSEIREDAVTAALKDGVLSIRLPKDGERGASRIQIG